MALSPGAPAPAPAGPRPARASASDRLRMWPSRSLIQGKSTLRAIFVGAPEIEVRGSNMKPLTGRKDQF